MVQRQAKPLRMRSPVNGHEAVYEWHQKRAHELVAGLGVAMDGHAWQFGEPVEGGPSYHARVASIIAQVTLTPTPAPAPAPALALALTLALALPIQAEADRHKD